MTLKGFLTAAAIALSIESAAIAATSQAWVLRNRSDFLNVKLDGVALGQDGAMRLSARSTQVLDPAQPNVWCLARDPRGRLYAGGGNEGKVFRITRDGAAPEVFFDSGQLEVHAMAFDSKGRLYAATSPRGSVYMVTEEGAAINVFDPEETYIWAIAFDDRDRLYVATGQRGRVYRVDAPGPNAAGKVVLDGREDHIRSLAKAEDGSLYAGSDQNGILYRIAPDGAVSVVYDTPMREIASITTVKGQIYLAALAPLPRQRAAGMGGPSGGGVTRIRVTADDSGGEPEQPPGGGEEPGEGQAPSRQREQPRPAAAESYFGAVYRVTPDGYGRKIWESREALPLSLIPYGDRVMVGTGNDGRVILLDESGEATDFVMLTSQQVNDLIPDGQGGFFAAASNLGQVVRISPGAAEDGNVTSGVLDAGFTSSWGALSWTADVPSGASVRLRVRTGNTEEPDDSWSAWSEEYARPDGVVIERPRGRYLQWRAFLRGAGAGRGPVLRGLEINYLQDNLPPEITSVDVMAPGVVLAGAPGGGGGEAGEAGPPGRRSQNQPRRSFEKGKRAVSWKAEDANNDALRYDVFFKAEDEELWKPLTRNLQDEFYTWDSTAMPDGVYRIQVTATDAPSSPPGTALSGSRTSAAFDVDNTPPVVGPVEARLRSRVAEVTFTVQDSFSAVGDAAYSLDAADWIPLQPADKIADSLKEAYRFTTGELEPGEHTVTVKARDRAGNSSAGKVVIRVEKPERAEKPPK